MPKSEKKTEYQGLHIGQLVRKAIESKNIDFAKVADLCNLTPTGMHHRMKNPTFGDIYDIIKVSEVIDKDIMSLIFNELNKRNPKLFSQHEAEDYIKEINILKDLLEKLKSENKSLYDIINIYKDAKLKDM